MSYPLADALYQQLLATLPPGRPYDRAALESDALPRLVGHYLRHALQHRADDALGRIRSLRSDAFDHHHPDVQAAYEQYAAALTAHAQVPADAWAETLRDAVDRVTAYLVRPADTLAAYLYQDADGPLPAHRVLRGMAAFAAYPYLREVLGAYVEQKDAETFDRGRLTTLLGRIDREMTKPYGAADWLGLLRPLFDLARHAGLDAVSTDTLRTFFAARGADAIVERLDAETRRGGTELDEAALRPLLEGGAAPGGTAAARPEPDAEPEPAGRPLAPAPRTRAPEEPSAPAPASPEAGPVPLWKKYQNVSPAPASPARPAAAAPAGEAVPLWKRFHKAPDAPASPGGTRESARESGREPAREPARDVVRQPALRRDDLATLEQDVLGDDAEQDRRRYIRDLFSGSEADYATVLARLQRTDTWAEASQIIASDVFRRHQVNIYSDVAIAFTDAAERRYRS